MNDMSTKCRQRHFDDMSSKCHVANKSLTTFDDMSSKWHLNLLNDMELDQTKTIQDQTRHNHTKYFKTIQKRIEKN